MLCGTVLFLALAGLALGQEHCDSPPQWTSKNFYFSPAQGHIQVVEAEYTYDKTNQRKSWRERDAGPSAEPIHRIELGAERIEYVINERTGACIAYPLRFPFYAHDVPVNARFSGLFYVGSDAETEGSVELSSWNARLTGSYWDGSFTSHGCIPYHSNHYNASTFGIRFESIVDVSPGIDPNDFIPPASCHHAAEELRLKK
eukprot:scpid83742/ scgid24783/ Mammalian ependymin-related protein 1